MGETVVLVNGIMPSDFAKEIEDARERRKREKEERAAQKAALKEQKAAEKAAKAEAKQAAKDDKLFIKIREDLITKVFGADAKKIEGYKQILAEFQNDEKRKPKNAAEEIDNSIDVAKGARATEKSTKRTVIKAGTAIISGGLGAGLAAEGLTSTASGVIGETILAAAGAAGFALGATIGLVIGAVLYKACDFIITLYRSSKIQKFNRADTAEKEAVAVEKIKIFLEKVEKFTDEITKDKQMLVNKRRELGKKKFEEFLQEYITSKLGFLKEIGIDNIPFELKDVALEAGKEAVVENAAEAAEGDKTTSKEEKQSEDNESLKATGQSDKENLENAAVQNKEEQDKKEKEAKLEELNTTMGGM